MAWLNATPKPPAGSKRAEAKGQPPPLSRLAQAKKDGITPQMPANPMPHMVARLIEIGITEATGMGPVPLSWREIAEWSRLTGVELAPWEVRLIRQLSIDYVAESRRAEDENCPPPWSSAPSQAERDIEEDRLRLVLG